MNCMSAIIASWAASGSSTPLFLVRSERCSVMQVSFGLCCEKQKKQREENVRAAKLNQKEFYILTPLESFVCFTPWQSRMELQELKAASKRETNPASKNVLRMSRKFKPKRS
jgi:hypothetical protein